MDKIHLTIIASLLITVCFVGTTAADKNHDRTTNNILNQTWNIGDAYYLNSYREDLIFNPTNAMFDRQYIYLNGNITNGKLPDNETLPIPLVLFAVILGSLGITLFVWYLDKRCGFYIISS
jgi:hypothetical protein